MSYVIRAGMVVKRKNQLITDGLILHLDPTSYPGSGTVWNDLSGMGNNVTVDYSSNFSSGLFTLTDSGGFGKTSVSGLTANSTVVFWIKTTDEQSLFLCNTTGQGSYYLGAFRVGNKQYYSGCGSPVFYMDTVERPNIYDYVRDNIWHMIEFKSVNLSAWAGLFFNKYTSYIFGNGSLGLMLVYNRNLSPQQSLHNYNATIGRFT